MGGQISNTFLLLFITLASFTYLFSSSLSGDQFSLVGSHDYLLSEERVTELFQQWKETHGKEYTHAEEAEKRFENFRANLKYIMEKNSKRSNSSSSSSSSSSHNHVVGLNIFADMSNEEFKQLYTSKINKKPFNRSNTQLRYASSCEAPDSLDWRNYGVVTDVKDQGQCGSCWAFSTTGAIEGINALVNGDLISLSEQELVDCDPTNYGCNGGYMDYAFAWVVHNGGIDTESDYPYSGVDGICDINKVKNKVVTIDGYTDIEADENALLCAVAKQPVSVGIIGSAFDFQLYTGGIYDGDCSSSPFFIDHAVVIVGYGSTGDEDYWIIKNSWGKAWGMEGYAYIKRNTNLKYGVCAINAMASYPTKQSSSPSPYPSPTSPPPPRPPTPPPPPPPSPCGTFTYCSADETCCCLFEFFGFCWIHGCCEYESGVCCEDSLYCCPSGYPICDIQEGLCLKNSGDSLGLAANNLKMAKHKLPWSKVEEKEKKEKYQPLQWKRNPVAAMR